MDGKTIRAWRKQLGITQEQLSATIQKSQTLIAFIETGRRPQSPTRFVIVRELQAEAGRRGINLDQYQLPDADRQQTAKAA